MLIPQSVLKIRSLCDTSSVRWGLGCISLERSRTGKPVAVATNGVSLAAVTWNEPDASDYPLAEFPAAIRPDVYHGNRPRLVSSKTAAAAGRLKLREAAKKRRKPILSHVVLDESAKLPTLAAINGEPTILADVDSDTEIRFPRWRDQFPNYDLSNSTTVVFNARVLRDALDAIIDAVGDPADRDGSPVVDVRLTLAADNPHESLTLLTARNDDGREMAVVIAAKHERHDPTPAPCVDAYRFAGGGA